MFKTILHPAVFLIILIFTLFSGSESNMPRTKPLYDSSDRIMIAAHRGSHENYPENSLPAIQECIDKGIDIVEIDIRETRDKIPVLLHDKTLTRTTGYNYKISELSFEETRKFNLLHQETPTIYKIPSLKEVLELTKGKVILNLDFKVDDIEAMKRAYQLIIDNEMEEEIIFTVNDLKVIPELYNFNPHIRIMPVAFSWWKINTVMDYKFLDIIQLYHRAYSNYNLHRLEKNNLTIWVNSLNKYDNLEMKNKKGFERLLAVKKVNVIQTDYPERLLNYLKEKGLHD